MADIRLGGLQKLRDAALDDAALARQELAGTELSTHATELAKRKSATEAIPEEIARIDRVLTEQLGGG